MAIPITGLFKPKGSFPLVEDIDLLGGFRAVATIADRDAVPELDRKWGMLCYVLEDGKTYQLLDQGNGDVADNTNWVEFQTASSTTNGVVGYSTTFSNTSLSNGILVITHNLGAINQITTVTIKDDTSRAIEPDDIEYVDENTLKVYLNSAVPITGTWTILVTALTQNAEQQPTQDQTTSNTLNGPLFNSTTFN